MPDPALLGIAIVVFLIAGLVKGVIGLGMPTVVMGLLTVVMPPAAAASLLLMPTVITNIWQLMPVATLWPLLRRLSGLLVGLFVGAMFNGLPTLGAGHDWARQALGAILAVYGAWCLAGRRFPAPGRHEPWLSPLVGYATGAITAATGIFVFPLVPYVQSLQMDKDRLVQAMGIIFCAATLALALRLGTSGALQTASVIGSLAYLLPAVIGMWAGQWVRQRVSEAAFKRAFFIGVLTLGLYMMVA